MKNKILKFLFAFFAMGIGLYPIIYFVIDMRAGFLGSKGQLLANMVWYASFYTHIGLGGLALLIGWVQFSPKFRANNLKLHRQIGKVYVVAVLLSALTGIYIGFYANGGVISATGFVSLGIIWFITTAKAYTTAKAGDIAAHQKMMIYSYAVCFAAVTLRLWLPILIPFLGFPTAYITVSWLCWVPNLLVAHGLIRKLKIKQTSLVNA